MKRIMIMRHAKSDWNNKLPDFDRPLNQRGRESAHFMGTLLKGSDFLPDLVLSSSAERAQETCALFTAAASFSGQIEYFHSFYEGDEQDILDQMRKIPSAINSVLILGHNPTLQHLIALLCSDNSLFLKLPTAGILCLDMLALEWEDLKPSENILRWFLTPKILQQIFSRKDQDLDSPLLP